MIFKAFVYMSTGIFTITRKDRFLDTGDRVQLLTQVDVHGKNPTLNKSDWTKRTYSYVVQTLKDPSAFGFDENAGKILRIKEDRNTVTIMPEYKPRPYTLSGVTVLVDHLMHANLNQLALTFYRRLGHKCDAIDFSTAKSPRKREMYELAFEAYLFHEHIPF